MLDVFLVKLYFLFGIHQIIQHRQQRHVFFARVRHQTIIQVLSEPAEFAPARGIETLHADVADELDQRGADWADNAVLVSQMRADALIARFAEVGEQLGLFKRKMTLTSPGSSAARSLKSFATIGSFASGALSRCRAMVCTSRSIKAMTAVCSSCSFWQTRFWKFMA